MSQLESPLLNQVGGYIDGQWVHSEGRSIAVINPATGDHLADAPDMDADQAQLAVESAERAGQRDIPIAKRRRWLEEITRLLNDNQSELARIITLEQGKPLSESASEVQYAAGFFQYYSRHLDRLESEPLAEHPHQLNWTVHHRPAGVVGLITPWNFPLAMLAKKLSAALAAGCTTVTKPAELTPLTTIALWNLLQTLDLDKGRANLVIGQPKPIGEVLCTHPAVRLISFTGSTEVGRLLMASTAPQIKRLGLELGGNAPFIVMEDANLPNAVQALMANKFRCAGQTCVCTNRVYVQASVEKEFIAMAAERIRLLRVGNGLDAQTQIGPLIHRQAFDKVDRHVKEALSHGAKRIVGADRPRPTHDWGAFYTPTLLSNVNSKMLVSQQETFGPVVAVQSFESIDQIVELANGTPYGLAAYVFGQNEREMADLIGRLRFGHVGWNTGSGPTPEAPFGGMKQSGFGREGGVEGLLEFCETQTVARKI
ncbi:MAG: NAD-dependent succinate-semialdehyde dehydrogenase [Phycisphaerales bacterium]|nr:NAD-dependent succinate-semialdehyde dehydrogenase [Phycisphaerales bacterium]